MPLPSYDDILHTARGHFAAAESLAHAERVAETARALAVVYGVAEELAALAGLVHDWARDIEGEDLVRAALDRGLAVTELDREVPYLLHARVGKALVGEQFPEMPEAVIEAVEAHTCGAGTMDDLSKLLYVADMIEPARDFAAVESLRAAVGDVSLGELFRRAYTRSVEHLISTRRHIHPDTVAVWNAHVAEEGPA